MERLLTRLITKSRRTGTLGNYESAWKKSTSWCDRQKIDPLRCSLNHVLEYLAYLFNDENLEYRTIGVHRSAFSAYHTYVDVKPVGQDPLVYSLMPEIFNLYPLQPKYMFVWDVQVVLNYFLKSKWGCTGTLPDKEISLKLSMFLVLTSSLTASRLHCLDIRCTVNTGDKTTFHFHKLQENWRKGNAPHSLSIYSYRTDEELCVVKTLNRYLKGYRGKERKENTAFIEFLFC